MAKRPDQPVVSGEMNPVFQGVYSSRIELKQWVRRVEDVLTNAEKLTALAGVVNVGCLLGGLRQGPGSPCCSIRRTT